jgi:hypothetical protein
MTTPGMPSFVHCVSMDVGRYSPDYGKTWCGRTRIYRQELVPVDKATSDPAFSGMLSHLFENDAQGPMVRVTHHSEYVFTDATGALLEGRSKGRSLVCPDCAAAMREALDAAAYRPDR